MKRSSTKGALLTSAIALMLCFVMLLGTTFAWFTDEVTSANNRIQAGTLKIDLLVKNPKVDSEYQSIKTLDENGDSTAIFNYDNWEPGYAEFRNVKVVNQGTLALKYTLCIVVNEDPAAVEDLAKAIDVYYAPEEIAFVNDRSIIDPEMRLGTLAEVLAATNGQLMIDDNMLAGETDCATLILKMREDAGNEFQGTSVGATF